MTRERRAWLEFVASRALVLAADTLSLGAVYIAAFLLRFDFQTPRWGWRLVAYSFVTVCSVHWAVFFVCGCLRVACRRFSFRDLPRFVMAMAVACGVLTALRVALPVETFSHIRPPYSVTLMTFALGLVTLAGWRILWSWYFFSQVRLSELLERPMRRMDTSSAAAFFVGKTVMVTGAGGSIGSELVRQVVNAGAGLVLLVERGENALYEIDRELRQQGVPADRFRALMTDINDATRMDEIFTQYHPAVVLHAAAYKHVPMVEMNPIEGERNNTQATRLLAELSRRHGVGRFVMISTDKAVNPVSVMGRTKREAEKAIMALNADGSPTSFCAVRFGNVFGSSGSVVPLFREQIARHGPVTVTHPDMVRYFMTVQEAVGLVLQAASRREKAIYTLDMGAPVRILDLAEQMIRQAGYRPYVEIPIVFTGIRPGEKLFEELDISERSAYKTDMARIYVNS